MESASTAEQLVLLAAGEMELRGRVLPASNVTFLADVTLDGVTAGCVYKPTAGERPLWDFPDRTLALRETAAYVLSEDLGWSVVPPTLLRNGPAGPGMVQLWCDVDTAQDPVDIVPVGAVPEGFLHVLDAVDATGSEVSLVHEDSIPLRRMAVFDAVVNNADRKGGHVLPMPDGHRYGVDHGVSFHPQNKLRTVLWGWAGDRLAGDDREALAALSAELADPSAALRVRLEELLSAREVAALQRRCQALQRADRMPLPSGEWPAIPWPAF